MPAKSKKKISKEQVAAIDSAKPESKNTEKLSSALKKAASSPSIDPSEIEKFSAMADEWWDASGKFAPLHKFNPARISYVVEKAKTHFKIPVVKKQPLEGLSVLDIGCGGGLLAEPIKRLGAEVTGIDASEKNIKIASLHAEKESLDIEYINTSAEELSATGRKFDIILNMEVIEHVADVESYIKSCAALLNPDGIMFIATINRTVKSFAFAIVGAEYILRWLPQGTHEWKKFLKPSEITTLLERNKLWVDSIKGFSYNPFKDAWHLSSDISVNYIIVAAKQ